MDINEMKKGLTYTREIYEEIADAAKQALDNLDHEDARTTSDEYGIYYNALAGLLRSDVLCSRETGTDGFPEIRIVSGSKAYQCREDVLRTILGEEADFVISPYADRFESYLDPAITYNIPGVTDETEDVATTGNNKGKQDVKALKKAHKAELEKLKKQYEAQIQELKKQQLIPGVSYTDEATAARQPILPLDQDPDTIIKTVDNPELTAKVQNLEKANAKLTQANQQHQAIATKQKEQITVLSQQLKQKTAALAERDKYQYDPVYDHYYSDELPEIMAELDSSKSDLVFKGIAILGCIAGIAISALTGFFQFI